MCFGCPKWMCPAICCAGLVLLIQILVLYSFFKPCARSVRLKNPTSPNNTWSDLAKPDVNLEKPNSTVSLPTTTPIIISTFSTKTAVKCVIVKGNRKTGLRSGGFMHTHFELTCNGTIQGETTLWPEPSFFGLFSGDFTGCSEIHLFSEKQRLWMSNRHKFATSPKNESHPWSEHVPKAVIPLVKKFALMHGRC